MALEMTREELRSDIREIATEVVTTVVQENNHVLIRMINEDLAITNRRIDSLDKRVSKQSKQISVTLRTHTADPQAHPHKHAKA